MSFGGSNYRSARHIPELDGVRGLAILMVLMYHFRHGFPPILLSFDRSVLRLGWSGVDLFFVLSGFLISGILLDTMEYRKYYLSFYGRRILRIFPLYLIAVFAYFRLVVPLAAHYGHPIPSGGAREIWFWLHASNFPASQAYQEKYLPHFWSLSVEEQFYLVWPLILRQIRRNWFIPLCVGIVLLSTGLRFAYIHTPYRGEDLYRFTPFRLDGLAVGGLVAMLVRNPQFVAWARQNGKWLVSAILMFLAAAIYMGGGLGRDSVPMQTFGYTAFALTYGCLVCAAYLMAGTGSALPSVLRNPTLRAFGKYSYAIYILHFPLTIATTAILGRTAYLSQPFRVILWTLCFAGGIGISFFLGYLSWNLLEKHCLALKKWFVAEPPMREAAASMSYAK